MADWFSAPPAAAAGARLGMAARLRALFLRSEPVRGYTLLSPTLVLMILALATPIVVMVTLSFWTQTYLDFDRSFSLSNYLKFFEKPIYPKILWKSIRISGAVTLATVLLAYPCRSAYSP